MEYDFSVGHRVLTVRLQQLQKFARKFNLLEALDAPTAITNEMGMLLGMGFPGFAHGVTPDTVFSPHAVNDRLHDE
jgi:hypothetical protein